MAGELPQPGQRSTLRMINFASRKCFGIEHRLQRVMAQVVSDADAFDPGLVRQQRKIRCDIKINRQRRTHASCGQRVSRHDMVGQHGDLAAGKIHRRQPFASGRIQRRIRLDAQRRRGDMNAQTAVAARQLLQRKRVVDLGGFRIIDAVGLDFGKRQIRRESRRRQIGESRSLGKMFKQETPQMKLVQIGQRPAAFEQACG